MQLRVYERGRTVGLEVILPNSEFFYVRRNLETRHSLSFLAEGVAGLSPQPWTRQANALPIQLPRPVCIVVLGSIRLNTVLPREIGLPQNGGAWLIEVSRAVKGLLPTHLIPADLIPEKVFLRERPLIPATNNDFSSRDDVGFKLKHFSQQLINLCFLMITNCLHTCSWKNQLYGAFTRDGKTYVRNLTFLSLIASTWSMMIVRSALKSRHKLECSACLVKYRSVMYIVY